MNPKEDAESQEWLLLKSFDEPNQTNPYPVDGSDSDPESKSSCVSARAPPAGSCVSKLQMKFVRQSRCLIIIPLVIISAWAMLRAGGYLMHAIEAPDSQSPPWYPTPPGGSLSTWAESYTKAAKLVEKMTLAEKVNVTTGTGQSFRMILIPIVMDNEC
jgi:hypothetical protein